MSSEIDDSPQILKYSERKERERKRQADQSAKGRDIGPIPEVVDPGRRAACRLNLQLYLETYHAPAFPLAWSEDHIDFIAKTQVAILDGTLKAQAMPRGSGKTTIFVLAILWAVLYGHCPLAVLIAAEDGAAGKNLEMVQSELEVNELLFEDFPEVCYPIACLERINNRTRGQTCCGQPTRMRITQDRLVFPTIEGSVSSGYAIVSAGLTGGRIRGVKHTLPDGRIVRPKVVLVDDPQTRKSAASASESRTRERILNGDVRGMAGPGESISILMAVTVIYRGDMADRMLNRTINPIWRGERKRMLKSLPSKEALELWERYWQIRADDLRNDGDGSVATEFYRQHRAAMDDGAEASWEDRKQEEDLSAIQHAMNLYLANKESFFAEYQNDPLDDSQDGDEFLSAEEIRQRLSKVDRGVVPLETDYLTCHIDVHDRLLYYAVGGWSKSFRGFVVDYGTWPEQTLPYFSLRDCWFPLGEKYPKATTEGAIKKGLEELIDYLCGRDWSRETGDLAEHMSLALIDEGYESKLVHRVIRRSKHKRILRAAKGWAVKAANVPMTEWKERDTAERVGHHWRYGIDEKAGVRRVLFDPNVWKSFVHKRLAAAEGDAASLTLFGSEGRRHELIADHLTAEFRTITEGRGRRVDEWRVRPGAPDNHFLDNLVGSAVAASVIGCVLPDILPTGRGQKKQGRRKGRRRRGITYSE
ncbi:terminase gpA endonuclease subunit [Stratiformator vulcanicus]|uniref:Phage terminase large subunit (GpA) n=1 Tax=Stratiformator vulcanicus TaxID=2527980 RepID=A0A517R769_9PLAN|nr:terminase gpA endonuclease subunit [Stratiformator vulcanicus]QDT39736.1 Phage terminase large subunit (GpA) [Stratiformator vulcanicus]